MEPEPQNHTEEQTEVVNETSSSEEKAANIFSVLGYIIPILFFIPLLDEKTKSVPAVKFHANQQLIILILFIVLQFLHMSILMMLGSLGYLLMNVANLAIFALAIYGALSAHRGQMKELPLIGHFRILK